jgi:HB1, ASXL, restriction endonuclease HTH domain
MLSSSQPNAVYDSIRLDTYPQISTMPSEMSDFLKDTDRKIALLEQEIQELRVAQRVFRRFTKKGDDDSNGALTEVNGKPVYLDLRTSTVVRAAQTILSEAEKPLHFTEVFRAALERGYRGRKSGGEPQTFWAIMKRTPEIFRAVGEGKFTLKEIDN